MRQKGQRMMSVGLQENVREATQRYVRRFVSA
jgi:hypothetical protein